MWTLRIYGALTHHIYKFICHLCFALVYLHYLFVLNNIYFCFSFNLFTFHWFLNIRFHFIYNNIAACYYANSFSQQKLGSKNCMIGLILHTHSKKYNGYGTKKKSVDRISRLVFKEIGKTQKSYYLSVYTHSKYFFLQFLIRIYFCWLYVSIQFYFYITRFL